MSKKYDWRHGGIIYQVYPRSFKSSADGETGDLKGITEKLPYIQSLGVDAIWLSPFFKSPMKDYGYDISDYCDVDPMFGTLADFDVMLEKAHELGLKIIVDMILCHTSDQHSWFKESRSSRDNPKSDWYVWADPKKDGSPPNNWQSVFGGSSWTFSVERGQYYFHNFLREQPHVNLYSEGARQAVLDATRFWLDRGVDGIRLDAAAHYFYDQKLRDNPYNDQLPALKANMYSATPYMMQLHKYDTSQKDSLIFVEQIRTLLDEYKGRIAIGELGGQRGLQMSALYTKGPKRLHTAYNFSLITGDDPSAERIKKSLKGFERYSKESWPSWAFSNHDSIRVASRWYYDKNGFHHDPRLSKCLNAVLLSLRGTLFLYQGEELGLPEVEIPYELLQDPFGINIWPMPGRDGCRTPMPWVKDRPHGGFTTGNKVWLPVSEDHSDMAVDVQESDENSTLNFTRAAVKWRREHPAMISGDIDFLKTPHDKILGFIRKSETQKVLCVFNMSAEPAQITLPSSMEKTGGDLFDAGQQTGAANEKMLNLPAYGIYILSSPLPG